MSYRILVDENIDPQTANLLQDQDHEAVHVEDTLGKGVDDPPIADYARENEYLVLTNDTDFLQPDRRRGLTILYCPENAMRAQRLASLVDTLAAIVPNSSDLPAVTWITEENLSE
jgi:predicted nuclease of predicted toxin-antitoxin system